MPAKLITGINNIEKKVTNVIDGELITEFHNYLTNIDIFENYQNGLLKDILDFQKVLLKLLGLKKKKEECFGRSRSKVFPSVRQTSCFQMPAQKVQCLVPCVSCLFGGIVVVGWIRKGVSYIGIDIDLVCDPRLV